MPAAELDSLTTLAQEAWRMSVGHGTSRLHPFGIAAGLAASVGLLMAPRVWAFLPIIAFMCFVSPAQRIAIAGVDLYLIRVLALVGLVRVFSRDEVKDVQWRALDYLVLAFSMSTLVVFTIQQGPKALVTRAGALTEMSLIYFVLRCVVRDRSDLLRIGWAFAILAIPAAVLFMIEKVTARNIFSVLGGSPLVTQVRNGRLRCQGPFPHAIMAGVFWATAMPFVSMLLLKPGQLRMLGLVGLFSILLIVFATSSSTPVSLVILFFGGCVLWFARAYMSYLRWGAVAAFVFLSFAMNAPVYYLIARIDLVGGSTGWHRSHLIEKAIAFLPEWFLFGTTSTEHWGWGLGDVTNQYILEGVRGGFLSFVLFSALVVVAFVYVSRGLRANRSNVVVSKVDWLVGIAIFLHACAFISVAYFGQPIQMWMLALAATACLPGQAAPATARASHAPHGVAATHAPGRVSRA